MIQTGVLVVQRLIVLLRNSHHPVFLGHSAEVDVWLSVLVLHLDSLVLVAVAFFSQEVRFGFTSVVYSLTELNTVSGLAAALTHGVLTAFKLSLTDLVVGLTLSRGLSVGSGAMSLLDREVALLNLLDGNLALSCARSEKVRGWCLVHHCGVGLRDRVVTAKMKVT